MLSPNDWSHYKSSQCCWCHSLLIYWTRSSQQKGLERGFGWKRNQGKRYWGLDSRLERKKILGHTNVTSTKSHAHLWKLVSVLVSSILLVIVAIAILTVGVVMVGNQRSRGWFICFGFLDPLKLVCLSHLPTYLSVPCLFHTRNLETGTYFTAVHYSPKCFSFTKSFFLSSSFFPGKDQEMQVLKEKYYMNCIFLLLNRSGIGWGLVPLESPRNHWRSKDVASLLPLMCHSFDNNGC